MSNEDQVTITQADRTAYADIRGIGDSPLRDAIISGWYDRQNREAYSILARHRLAQPASDREALFDAAQTFERLRDLTPVWANEKAAQGLHGVVNAIAGAALDRMNAALTPSNRSDAVDGETALREGGARTAYIDGLLAASTMLRSLTDDGIPIIDADEGVTADAATLTYAADMVERRAQRVGRAALSNTGTTNGGGK